MKNIITLLTLVLCITSCSTTNPLFQTTDSSASVASFANVAEPVLKNGDKITMSIWGHEELSIGSVNSSFSSNQATGKWLTINKQGEVNLPKLGVVKIAGLTTNEVSYFLQEQYGKTLKDPIINVKVLNHTVTILGEVNEPGIYHIDNEKLSLIQLIGLSKGLSPYAKNDQIEVIRTIDDKTQKLSVNLRDLNGFSEKNIFLQPDDIVYVAPEKTKTSDTNLQKASIVASILTGVAVIYSVFIN